MGDVEVRFFIDRQGTPQDVEAVSGHPMLTQAAIDNVRTWKFAQTLVEPKYFTTTFRFEFTDNAEDYDYGPRTKRHGYSLVEVEVTPLMIGGGPPHALSCPKEKMKAPGKGSPSDYLELKHDDYTVRIDVDGSVTWRSAADRHSFTIASSRARQILESFRTDKFWNLCGEYVDNPLHSVVLTVSIDGVTKRVQDVGRVARTSSGAGRTNRPHGSKSRMDPRRPRHRAIEEHF